MPAGTTPKRRSVKSVRRDEREKDLAAQPVMDSVEHHAGANTQSELEPYTYGKFEFSANGLRAIGKPTYAEWQQVGHKLAVDARSIAFQVGDWLRIGEEHFGELAAQVIDARQWQEETVRVYRYVAERVPMENRMLDRGLTYSHHQIVAKLSHPEQREWLGKAAEGDGEKPWPVARLKREIKHADGEASPLTFGITVFCADEADQQAGCRQLDALGRRYKTFVGGGLKEA